MTPTDDTTAITPPGPQPAPVTGKPDIGQMIVIHTALTREFGLLPAIVGAVQPGDWPRMQGVAAHAELALSFLHAHHDGEDRLLWPLLLIRLPLEAQLIQTMERQHAVIADLVIALRRELTEWTQTATLHHRHAITTNLASLHTALDEHLRLEETAVLPLIQDHLTVPEWNAPFDHAQHHTPVKPRDGLLLVPDRELAIPDRGLTAASAVASTADTPTASAKTWLRIDPGGERFPDTRHQRRLGAKARAGLRPPGTAASAARYAPT